MSDLNDFRFKRQYKGPIKMVIFDWSGTIFDYGCLAPTKVFVAIFKDKGIDITWEQARGPMGRYKKDHIRCLFEWYPSISKQWKEVQGRDWTEDDVEELYQNFIPKQLEVIHEHDDVIPGALEVVEQLRSKGVKIGGTTGFFKAAAELYQKIGKEKGYVPDQMFCSDDVPTSRPAPWMIYRNMEEENVYPPESVVKVDDSSVGMVAALNAGCWSVGLTRTGTAVGKSEEELSKLPKEEVKKLLAAAAEVHIRKGAHYVIESVKNLPSVIEDIERRLKNGEKP